MVALAGLVLAACSSTPNRPVPRRPSPALESSARPAAATDEDQGGNPVEAAGSVRADGLAAAPEGGAGRDVILKVAGQPIRAAELIESFLHRDSPAVMAAIQELVLSRIWVAEAGELGIVLEADTVETAFAKVRERMEDEVRRGASDLTVEEFIDQRLGLDPGRYLERVRRETTIDLLSERVVRAWLLASQRVEARVIVLSERDQVDVVQAKLAAGQDFAALAREFSVRESADRGGRIPPVVRGPSALARLAFSTPVGQVGGPAFEGGQWMLLQAVERPTPIEGSWQEVGAAVEASLAERPIEDPEFWQWKSAILARHEVDMTPFVELMGGLVAEDRPGR